MKTSHPTGRGGSTSAMGEELRKIGKFKENERLIRIPSSGLAATFSLREKDLSLLF